MQGQIKLQPKKFKQRRGNLRNCALIVTTLVASRARNPRARPSTGRSLSVSRNTNRPSRGGETQAASGVSGLATLIGLHDCTLDTQFIHFVDSPLVLRTSSFFLFSVPAIHPTFHNISLTYGISSNLYIYQVTPFISGLRIYIRNLHLTKYRHHLQTLHQTTSARCRTHRPRKLLPLPIL